MAFITRDKNSIRHDDKVDSLAQGCKYFIDALAQSAHRAQAQRKHEEWAAMQQAFIDHPHIATDCLALGLSFRGIQTATNRVYDWVPSDR